MRLTHLISFNRNLGIGQEEDLMMMGDKLKDGMVQLIDFRVDQLI